MLQRWVAFQLVKHCDGIRFCDSPAHFSTHSIQLPENFYGCFKFFTFAYFFRSNFWSGIQNKGRHKLSYSLQLLCSERNLRGPQIYSESYAAFNYRFLLQFEIWVVEAAINMIHLCGFSAVCKVCFMFWLCGFQLTRTSSWWDHTLQRPNFSHSPHPLMKRPQVA